MFCSQEQSSFIFSVLIYNFSPCLTQIGHVGVLTRHRVPVDNAGVKMNFMFTFYFLLIILRFLTAPSGLCLSPIPRSVEFSI